MLNYIEDNISKAIKRMEESGELKSNSFSGKPLELSGYFRAPKDTRAINRYLSDAGFIPPKLEALQAFRRAEDQYKNSPSPEAKKSMIELRLKYDVLR